MLLKEVKCLYEQDRQREQVVKHLEYLGILSDSIIREDLSVDVFVNVILKDRTLRKIPVQFNIVEGNFICSNLRLTSLKGSPRECRNFNCSYNVISSMEYAPSVVKGDIYSDGNPSLVSLHNIHKTIKQIDGGLYIGISRPTQQIKSHILGLMLIRNLKEITMLPAEVADIINKHLKGDRDIHLCQEELISAGFEH